MNAVFWVELIYWTALAVIGMATIGIYIKDARNNKRKRGQ